MSRATRPNNLFNDSDPPADGERFELLARLGRGVEIERIVSGPLTAPGPHDQPHDEWVVLLRGRAALEVKGTRHELEAGDWLLLPAHTPHTVVDTSVGALWLAVHAREDPT